MHPAIELEEDGVAHEEDEAEVQWGYEGEVGPAHWGHLSSEFLLCCAGRAQSPIDLKGATVVAGEALEGRLGTEVLTLEQRARVMDLVHIGHTIQVRHDVLMDLHLDDVHYRLLQYHFHAPSEHTIEGEQAPLEVHFVHRSAHGQLAVIGVLVEEGEHDPIWDSVLSALPKGPGDQRHIEGLELDMNKLRPLPRRYFRYQGSLTTPPCSEGVEWVVMAERRQISKEQMEAIVSHLHSNVRPIQPLNDREIVLVSPGKSEYGEDP
jgi:carbonic anhydrase